jgi:hypothetical protein
MRQIALDMHGKYLQDWGTGSTHLACAFKNIPKYRDVKGSGKIVSKKLDSKMSQGEETVNIFIFLSLCYAKID